MLSNKLSLSYIDTLRWRATHQAEKLAYAFLNEDGTEGQRVTYAELDRHARSIAATLQQQNQEKAPVLLLYPPGLDYIIAFFGCIYAGIIAIPLPASKSPRSTQRIQSVVQNAEPSLGLTTQAFLTSTIQPLFSGVQLLQQLPLVTTDTIPTSAHLVWQEPLVTRESIAFLQYTSGSTGIPKGVMVSHGNLIANHEMIQSAIRHPEDTAYVSWLPLFHDMGLIFKALQAFYRGVPCIFLSPLAFLQKPVRWLQAITRYRAHTSGGPNFAYELCARKITPEQKRDLDLSCWKVAVNGAEPVRATTIDNFVEAFSSCGFRRETFVPGYGLAEATVFVSVGLKEAPPKLYHVESQGLKQGRFMLSPIPTADTQTLVACGRTVLDQKILIVNPDTSIQCTSDQVGEVWITGPNVTHGYWQRPEETAAVFHAFLKENNSQAFLRTGDLGALVNGELVITGRLKDLIILDGLNHYPQDIEQSVEHSHPALLPGCSAAFSVEIDDKEQLIIVAEVERRYRPLSRNASASSESDKSRYQLVEEEDIHKAIRKAIAEEHDIYVHSILLLKPATIAKTSSGKIQRRACRNGFLNNTLTLWRD